MARLYILALMFMGSPNTMLIGFSGGGAHDIEENEPHATLASVISISALLLLFIFNFYDEIIRALISSYEVAPVNMFFNLQAVLVDITDTLLESLWWRSGSAARSSSMQS